jgi:hypothetical protein
MLQPRRRSAKGNSRAKYGKGEESWAKSGLSKYLCYYYFLGTAIAMFIYFYFMKLYYSIGIKYVSPFTAASSRTK